MINLGQGSAETMTDREILLSKRLQEMRSTLAGAFLCVSLIIVVCVWFIAKTQKEKTLLQRDVNQLLQILDAHPCKHTHAFDDVSQ